jgi:hypothetical protein
VNKVWLHTYWLAWGPIAPSVTSLSDRQPRIQRAWMRSVAPPYYEGIGIAIRFGVNTLRFGTCTPLGSVTRPDLDDGIIESIFGRPVDKEQEGTWGGVERSA